MASRKKTTRLKPQQAVLAFKLGYLFNRFEWFFRWALHTRSEYYRLDSSLLLRAILTQLIPRYTSSESGNPVDRIASLGKRIADLCNHQAGLSYFSIHGYEEAAKEMISTDHAIVDNETIREVRDSIDSYYKRALALAKKIHKVLRDNAGKHQIADLPSHQDLFDLGQMLDQMAFPRLCNTYHFVRLVQYWCSWRYFYQVSNEPPQDAERIEIQRTMKILNTKALEEQLKRQSWKKYKAETESSGEQTNRSTPAALSPQDLRTELSKILAFNDPRAILVQRIRVLLTKLGFGGQFETKLKQMLANLDTETVLKRVFTAIETKLAKCFPLGTSTNKSSKVSKNDERNRWLCEKCKNKEITYDKVALLLQEHIKEHSKGWNKLSSGKSVEVTVKRFIKDEGLEPLPPRIVRE